MCSSSARTPGVVSRPRRLLLAALGLGMLGTLLAWAALDARPAFPVGTVILCVAALLAWRFASRWTAAAGGCRGARSCSARLVAGDGAEQLLGDEGVVVAIGRALQGVGTLGAIATGVAIGVRGRPIARPIQPPTPTRTTAYRGIHLRRGLHLRRGIHLRGRAGALGGVRAIDAAAGERLRRDRFVAIGSLVVISAIGAELLAAYNDTTGRPAELLVNVVFFAMLYGCPALLIRELARRTGRGWPAILLLSAAAGLLQAGVIDQALFSDSYGDVKGWEESLRATYVAPLGLGAYMLQNFVLGHVIYSFCAPLAVAEAMRPAIAERSWLGRRGVTFVAALWLAVAALIFADALGSEAHATAFEIAATLAVIAALVVAAFRVGPAPRTSRGRAPRVRTVLAVSFVAASAHAAVPETWLGVALAALVVVASGWLLARTARGRDWGLAHIAAVATGALLSRGTLAFFYYPLVGETSAERKYAHNVVMLLIVAAAGAYAIRRARDRVPDGPAWRRRRRASNRSTRGS